MAVHNLCSDCLWLNMKRRVRVMHMAFSFVKMSC